MCMCGSPCASLCGDSMLSSESAATARAFSQSIGQPSAIIICVSRDELNLIVSKLCVLQSSSEELRDEHQGPLAGPRPPAPGVQRLHVRHDRPLLGQRRRRLPDGQEEAQPESGRPHMAAARLASCPRHC
jgi:hypothetical protein